MKTTIMQCVLIAFALLIAILLGIGLFGHAFRSNMLLFASVWISTPIFAYFLNWRTLSSCFTLTGLRRVQVVLMTVVVAISFAMFAHADKVRNQIGEYFVEDYTSWRAPEPDVDDYGRPYYPEDWTAKTLAGKWGLKAFEFLLLAAIFALPAATWKASNAAIHKKEAECK